VNLLSAIPHGPQSFSPEMEGLVETSCNLAMIKWNEEENLVEIGASTRSAIVSELDRVRNELKNLGEKHSAFVTQDKAYPGWKPDLEAPFLKLIHQIYEDIAAQEVKLKAIHAGLECGLFTRLDQDLQIVSIGPEIKDGHSPDERVYPDTVRVIWDVLIKIMENLKEI
jgi:dipeptidase D